MVEILRASDVAAAVDTPRREWCGAVLPVYCDPFVMCANYQKEIAPHQVRCTYFQHISLQQSVDRGYRPRQLSGACTPNSTPFPLYCAIRLCLCSPACERPIRSSIPDRAVLFGSEQLLIQRGPHRTDSYAVRSFGLQRGSIIEASIPATR